jgi:hypothetical protein
MLLARSTDPTGRTPCEIRNKKSVTKSRGSQKCIEPSFLKSVYEQLLKVN